MNSPSYKAVFLGATDVGKTCLLYSLENGMFPDEVVRNTIGGGQDITFEITAEDGSEHKVVFWDTAGQERYAQIVPLIIRDSSVVIAVYAINEPSSFERIKTDYYMLKDRLSNDTGYILVANKIDLNNYQVSNKEACELLNSFEFKKKEFLEVSALAGTNLIELKKLIARMLSQKAPLDKPFINHDPQDKHIINHDPVCEC